MMRYWSVILLVWIGQLCAQSTFSILPPVGSTNHVSALKSALIGSEGFYAIGDRFDSCGIDGGIRQCGFLATFDYDGELLRLTRLVDEADSRRIYIYNNKFVSGKNDVLYVAGVKARPEPPGYAQSFLMKINQATGQIIKSKLILNPFDTLNPTVPRDILYDNDNRITVLNYGTGLNYNQPYIVELDTNLNITKKMTPKNDAISWSPLNIEQNENGSYELIGPMRSYDTLGNPLKSDIFYAKIDTMSNIVAFNTIDDGAFYSNLGFANRYIKNGENWILAVNKAVFFGSPNWFTQTAHIMCMAPQFDDVIWETRFRDLPLDPYNNVVVYSLTQDSTSGFLGAGYWQNEQSDCMVQYSKWPTMETACGCESLFHLM